MGARLDARCASFSAFDDLAAELGLEKIKTIGDCYMVAAGLPTPRADHAEATARMALDRLKNAFELEPRGTIKVKGKGEMETFLLKGAKK